jgi:hypothetical protein
MGRTICCALFALLAMAGTAFPQGFRHRHFVHPRPLVQVTRFYGWCPPWLSQWYAPLPYAYPLSYGFSYPVVDYTLPSPAYAFVGSAAASYPQLVFNDGTSYTVADYWRVDDQLHFITVEEGGTKFVPHTVPFDDLDLEQTKDRATAQGFRFIIRDKPIDQWLEDRAQERDARREKEKKR